MTTRETAPPEQVQSGRWLAAVQLVAAAVDGLALSSIAVHATVQLAIDPTTTGRVLALAAAVALVAALPLGRLIDRIGLRAGAAWGGVLSATALATYGLADSLVVFTIAATLFVVAQAASGSARHALAVAGVSPAERLRTRATMHTLLNAGLGVGTMLGAVLVATDSDAAFRTAYGFAAAVSLVGALAVLRLPTAYVASRSDTGLLLVLRDRRFTVATALAVVVQLTMPILSVLLPIWIVVRTSAPAWTAGVALAINTVIVIAGQRWWAGRLVDARSTARSAVLAAGTFAVSGVLLAATTGIDSASAAAVVVLAVAVLTVGEVSGGAATWAVALAHVPPSAEGRYQSAFSMSASAARIVGPLLALPVVLHAGPVGWIILTIIMATAGLAIAHMPFHRNERTGL